jgi:hypothetical protein
MFVVGLINIISVFPPFVKGQNGVIRTATQAVGFASISAREGNNRKYGKNGSTTTLRTKIPRAGHFKPSIADFICSALSRI